MVGEWEMQVSPTSREETSWQGVTWPSDRQAMKTLQLQLRAPSPKMQDIPTIWQMEKSWDFQEKIETSSDAA